MEHFEPNRAPVKEKSVYLLHLDAPRIIILSSVIVGLVIIAFLIGMNRSSDGPKAVADASQNSMLFSPEKIPGIDTSAIPAPPHTGEASALFSETPPASPLDGASAQALIGDNTAEKGSSKGADILTADNIETIIPPSLSKNTQPSEKKTAQAEKKVQKKKDTSRASAKKSRKKEDTKVVEVSSRVSKPEKTSSKVIRSGFSVQVGAFDTRTKAEKQLKELKAMHFETFIDKANVKGKSYYRVKVGPVPTRDEAVGLLKNVHRHPEYASSFMIKE